MGNIIAFDVDEENFRIAIKLFDKRLDNYTPINSFLKQRKIVFLKQLPQPILLMELNYHEIRLFEKDFQDFLKVLIDYFKENFNSQILNLLVTGYHGDSFILFIEKYVKNFKLPIVFTKAKQIFSTVFGIFSLLKESQTNLLYCFNEKKSANMMHEINSDTQHEKKYYSNLDFKYPYCLVNIKGGLSFYKVEDHQTCKRLGGSIIGESTCVNLVKLLAKTKTFFEAFDFGINGDNRNVDMTVGDIYGESIKNVLSSDIIASSLGKANKHIRKNDNKNTNEKSYSDVVRSICIMVAVNTAQLSSLYCQIEKLQKIVLVTSLLRNETFFALIQSAFQFFLPKILGVEICFVEDVEFLPCFGSLFMK